MGSAEERLRPAAVGAVVGASVVVDVLARLSRWQTVERLAPRRVSVSLETNKRSLAQISVSEPADGGGSSAQRVDNGTAILVAVTLLGSVRRVGLPMDGETQRADIAASAAADGARLLGVSETLLSETPTAVVVSDKVVCERALGAANKRATKQPSCYGARYYATSQKSDGVYLIRRTFMVRVF